LLRVIELRFAIVEMMRAFHMMMPQIRHNIDVDID